MDIGVGAFVLSSAVVSRQARGGGAQAPQPPQPAAAAGSPGGGGGSSLRAHLLLTLTKVSPLLVLGVLRLVVHSGVNYQAHVSEYG